MATATATATVSTDRRRQVLKVVFISLLLDLVRVWIPPSDISDTAELD